MYHRIIILALLFLSPGKSNSAIFLFSSMQFSDALPVQFWLTGCETFNEHHAAGVHHVCFCHPWNCDDEIKVQFTDIAGNNFSLLIVDMADNLLSEIPIEEVSSGVYQTAFTPSETSPEVCNQLVRLRVQQNAGFQGVPAPDLDEWTSSGDFLLAPWTTGAAPSVNTSTLGTTSEGLIVDYPFVVGLTYRISVNFTNTANTFGLFFVSVTDGSNVVQFSDSKSGALSGANVSDVLEFIATADTTRIRISLQFLGSTNTTTITGVTIAEQLGSDSFVAKTDCLDIREHFESILLTYSNHRDFAGLKYTLSSPEETFQIRIPAVFYHERYPEEDEVIELSTSLATLNGTVRKQKRLDTDYLPYYFHEKLKLILKHQTLSINNRAYVKQEAYEIIEGDKRWPVKMGRVWLSERDFVHRNIL